MKYVLVTGGTGYIGSHTVVELFNNGYTPIIIDNLSNSSINVLRRIEQIVGVMPIFYKADIQDQNTLGEIFSKYKIDGVIHFAAFKAVGESVAFPLRYYDNNVGGSISLLHQMQKHGVKTIIFSSSATVYGRVQMTPITEDFPLQPNNPYGFSKYMVEQVLRDLTISDSEFRVGILRYFNPVGAHVSGLIGEDPHGIPNNLMPYISQVAVGRLDYLKVFGNDYSTIDGTGVRDYIHVVDLAIGHVKALDYFKQMDSSNLLTINLGTGRGYSVLEVIAAFERVSGKSIKYQFVPRRDGDIDKCYADTARAKELLNFTTLFDLERMCYDSWNWQSKNPNGYNYIC